MEMKDERELADVDIEVKRHEVVRLRVETFSPIS